MVRKKSGIKYDTRELRRVLDKTPELLARHIGRAFDQHGQVYKNAMHARFGANLTDGRNTTSAGAGGKLASRSGALAGSIGFEVVGRSNLNTLRLIFFIGNRATISYAVTQEEGKTILGKPWLAIPLPAALTGTGRARIERPSLVRDDPAFFIFKSKAGNLIIAKRTTAGNFEPWWVLKKRVRVPARLGFGRTVRSKPLRKDLIARVRGAMVKALREAAA